MTEQLSLHFKLPRMESDGYMSVASVVGFILGKFFIK